jgi:hypothetical protein
VQQGAGSHRNDTASSGRGSEAMNGMERSDSSRSNRRSRRTS